MYQILIADDDYLVRSYLKTLNSWEQAGYEVAADVRDGEEALKVLEQKEIDVLITDISMPLMDGITLIEEVRKTNQHIYIIVLSCHDDFQYVKEAMRLGANEYVLKNSLDETSLYELLMNSKNHIISRKKKTSEEEQVRKLVKMGSQTLKYHFFNQYLAGNIQPANRAEKQKEAGIEAAFFYSAVISIFVKNWPEVTETWTQFETEQYSSGFVSRMLDELEQTLGNVTMAEMIYLGAGVFCCFLDLSDLHRSSAMRQRLTSVASTCYRFCRKEDSLYRQSETAAADERHFAQNITEMPQDSGAYKFGIGVSNVCIGEEGLRQAYQQAREMMRQSFYQDSGILYYDSHRQVGRELPQVAKVISDKIEVYLSGQKRKEFLDDFKKALEICEKENTDSRIVVQWVKNLDERFKISRPPEFYTNRNQVIQIQKMGEEYAELLGGEKKRSVPEGTSAPVRLAASFIHEHYRQQIGLSETSEAAGVNPAYLSYLFKQEMGIGFSNYLLECRMEYAKELLGTTNYKIKEVALESGFNDYHYFSKAFKKMHQMSPADYRKQRY